MVAIIAGFLGFWVIADWLPGLPKSFFSYFWSSLSCRFSPVEDVLRFSLLSGKKRKSIDMKKFKNLRLPVIVKIFLSAGFSLHAAVHSIDQELTGQAEGDVLRENAILPQILCFRWRDMGLTLFTPSMSIGIFNNNFVPLFTPCV